ncbi:TetR family transcriptional regulator [Cryptosporangium phraense]|uniref:TetR family transcriptional regulator n=1 Tax=Cryptosporangium phraense TaxID=2593070 RepID=A0A545AMP4_9ACTN|nr:TetR family transcriptional regulator [Cryptosporangium phraense]TQS42566.1 TetR family transcriptional regulator [Cryptosporangium phraense]
MTPRAEDSTRDRVVKAATAEFADFGIAGARVDRIAKAARTSKERVYAYFSSKEALYREVSGDVLAAVADATRMDPDDLPAYAGRVHDYYQAHPEHARIIGWGRLERSGIPADDPLRRAVAYKLEQLGGTGQFTGALQPIDALMLVNEIAMAWANQPDLIAAVPADERSQFLAARRAAIVAAVERLFPAAR